MKNILLFISFWLVTLFAVAQETVERTRKLTPEVIENFHVLKSNDTILHGQYVAYLKKKMIAVGRYQQNKKVGTWTFFDKRGNLCQRFNYDNYTLMHEAAEDSASAVRYIVDDSLLNKYTFVRPVRVGGRYYGYLKYANLIRLPGDLKGLGNVDQKPTIELLVSPGGRLAEFKLRIHSV